LAQETEVPVLQDEEIRTVWRRGSQRSTALADDPDTDSTDPDSDSDDSDSDVGDIGDDSADSDSTDS
jgi:hypothetical protein